MKRHVILPRKLNEAILATGLAGKSLTKGIDFIQYLLYKYDVAEEEFEGTNFVNIPSQTIKTFFDRNYNTLFMDVFTRNRIIIRSPFSIGSSSSQCFGYRLNDELMDFRDIDIADFPASKVITRPVSEYDHVVEDLRRIEFDIPAMINYVKNLNIKDLIKLNEEIVEDPLDLTPIFSKVKFKSNKPLKDALALAKKFRKDLVEYDNRYFSVRSDVFCKWKTITKKSSLVHTISKLMNQEYYAGRNETNFRLDTNLTNLDGVFFKNAYLRLDGEAIVDIDMKNSQPTLLSYVLSGKIFENEHLKPIVEGYIFPGIDKSQIDFELFIKLTETGILYDHLATMLCWKRQQAKQNFIKTMFADARWTGHNKKLLKELFPTIVVWMDDFKKLNKNNLAVMLQRIESRIFIDDIYLKLRKKGYTIYTKHDSVLCKSSEKPQITTEMTAILDDYGFNYRLE